MAVQPAEVRFESFLDRSAGAAGCHIWTGATKKDSPSKRGTGGYGVFSVNGRQVKAHRFAVEMRMGRTLDRTEEVDHSCHNRSCCNPAHLRVMSHAENTAPGMRRVPSRQMA